MERYDSYKDSGVDWIGQIPEHWETFRIKNVAKLFSGNGFPINIQGNCVGDYPVYKAGDLNKPSVYIDQSSNYISNNILAQYKFTKIPSNSILFPKIGEAMKKNGRKINLSSCCIDNNCSAFNVINDNVNILFFYYFLKIVDMAYFDNGGAIPCLNTSRLLSTISIVPPLSEQQAIAAYLDEETGKLDAAVEKLERMVEVLKERKQLIISKAVTRGLDDSVPLKDSGVEWIGQIPEKYSVTKLKYISNLFGRIGFRGYNSDDLNQEGIGAITISPSNITDTRLDLSKVTYLSWDKYYESPEIQVCNNDILLVKTGSSYGKSCYVSNLTVPATINPQLLRIEPKCFYKFLYYYLQSYFFNYEINCCVSGSTIPTLSQANIGGTYVVVPSTEEQQAIAAYLDEKVGKLDEAIEKQLRMIELLKERKQILISDVVTGKIKVAQLVIALQHLLNFLKDQFMSKLFMLLNWSYCRCLALIELTSILCDCAPLITCILHIELGLRSQMRITLICFKIAKIALLLE